MYKPKRNTNFISIIIILLVLTITTAAEYDFVVANNNYNGDAIMCKETEREALLKFKEGLIDKHGMISSWGRGNDCCKWEGIRCSNTTGHVIRIELVGDRWSVDSPHYLEGQINSALLELHNLNDLDLSENDFGGNKFPEFICSMSQLRHLNLGDSNFSGTLPPCLGNLANLSALNLAFNKFFGTAPLQIWNLTNLHSLDLSFNSFFGIVPPQVGNLVILKTLDLSFNNFSALPLEIENLTNLETLELSSNKFTKIVPPHVGNLVNLKKLYLSYNQFSTLPLEIENLTNLETLDLSTNNFFGIVPPQLWGLTNLETLYLSSNHFSDFVHPQLWRLTKLKLIDMSENDLTSSSIDLLFNMGTNHVAPSLKALDFGSNKLKRLPSCIWQFSMLEVLRVPFNSLEDTITEAHLTKLPNLMGLDLSSNSLTLDISPDWNPPFRLTEIDLSGCKLGPHFPSWLQTQSNFLMLDLSNNNISGEVPKWFWSLTDQVYYLNLSHNQLRGTIPDFSSIQLEYIDVSYNKFSGPIPLQPPSTFIFRISHNMFSGSLSFNCSLAFNSLMTFDLSSNQLAGKLPICWEKMPYLSELNLAKNSFSGEIPHVLGYLSSLQNLYLANNNFSGELPLTLKNCKQLRLIDIRDNMVTGSIPTWIGEFHETLEYLILHNNRFHGIIPPKICYLSSIRVLDLSGNSISGKIPPCFNNFTNLVDKNSSNQISPYYGLGISRHFPEMNEYTTVLWKHTESEFRRNLILLKLIDLSNNRLDGKIPRTFSSLKELQSLNLSRNRLTGNIDQNIGQMSSLECLDLSNNQLSGRIPNGMTQLDSLGVLDLANNNLSGKIPIGWHLQTLPASAYVGNIGLCGRPLPLCSGDILDPLTNNKALNGDEKDGGDILSLFILNEFGISIILGFILGFWGVVGSLIVNESWRRKFYNFFGTCGDWLFVRATIFWRKLRSRS